MSDIRVPLWMREYSMAAVNGIYSSLKIDDDSLSTSAARLRSASPRAEGFGSFATSGMPDNLAMPPTVRSTSDPTTYMNSLLQQIQIHDTCSVSGSREHDNNTGKETTLETTVSRHPAAFQYDKHIDHNAFFTQIPAGLLPNPPVPSALKSPINVGGQTMDSGFGASHQDHPDNCALFMTGLHKDVTVDRVLGAIRGYGRIYRMHILRAKPEDGLWESAAKVVFFEARAAQRFLRSCNEHGFVLDGFQARVAYDWTKSAEASNAHLGASRVLLIRGPRNIVHPDALCRLFDKHINFQVDKIISHGRCSKYNDHALVEFRFTSYRYQAQQAYMLLREVFRGQVSVCFGEDPCSLPPTCIPNEELLWVLFWKDNETARRAWEMACRGFYTLSRAPCAGKD